MQWTTTGDRITLPYIAPEDDLQSTPATIKALAEAVVAELELATPVGAILPYMGDVAPDGWLICDGSQYDPADLPELYAINGEFHKPEYPGEFRVPDFRGRAPFGVSGNATAGDAEVLEPLSLGSRSGDARVPYHIHLLTVPHGPTAGNPSASPSPGIGAFADGGAGADWPVPLAHGGHIWSDPLPERERTMGLSRNIPPSTVVNFIVYAGRPTAGITPVSTMPAMTTRMMIEARLAAKGIGEEEVKMLKEQLEALKTAEAK